MEDLKSKIESILFVFGDPVGFRKIAKILGISEKEIKKEVGELQEDYKNKGINILEKDGKVQMVSSPKNSDIIKGLVESSLSEELTPAALETLAVISYKEPILRQEIDEIRGVNSVFSLRTLMMKGLIEKYQHKGEKKDVSYRTTLDFLKKLGILKVSELPQYDELSKVFGENNKNGA
jgi:segregation and condensation protein B